MIYIYKNIGETPLEALERARAREGIGADVPMTYAGRLDPLVEGLLVVLIGEECKSKDEYTKLDKTYEFEILTGVSTDTYDLLGLVLATDFEKEFEIEKVKEYLEENKKTITQKYPPYSSKKFEGKQLHEHAREGNTPALTHEVTMYSWELLGERTLEPQEVLKIIEERIGLVKGDFRQEEILAKWREVFAKGAAPTAPLHLIRFRVSVSSGFYIRQLIHDIGQYVGIPMVTFHIRRTRIGDTTLLNQ